MSVADQIAKCGGRRFFLVLGACGIYTALFALDMLTESGFVTLQIATVGTYIAGNGAQKYMEIKNGNSN